MKKLLFVGPDSHHLTSLLSKFRNLGFSLSIAGDAIEALVLLETTPFDLVLIEPYIGRGNMKRPHDTWNDRWYAGLDVMRRIRAGEFASAGNPADLKIAVFTVLNMRAEGLVIKQFKPDLIIEKPQKIHDIVDECVELCVD